MKRTNIFFSSLLLIILVASCRKVDRLPETEINDNDFWKSEADFKAGANYLYTFLPGPNDWFEGDDRGDLWADETFGNSTNTISDGSRTAPATDNGYTRPYLVIRAANNILEKAEGAKDLVAASALNRYRGEALFFRAWGHAALVQRFGDIQLITKTLNEASPELYMARDPRDKVIDQVYADLDSAALYLPTASAIGTADFGRVSKTAASAFKARVALFEGTRAKFHNYGDPAKHLNIAVAAANAVMTSSQHSLFSSYYSQFQIAGEGFANKENILVKQFGINNADRVLTHNYARRLENGVNGPTQSLVDAYLMKDGLPISKSPLYKRPSTVVSATTITKNEEWFINRDPRMTATIMKRGDEYTTSGAFTISTLNLQKTGYMPRKYFNRDDWNTQAGLQDRTLIRYAEVLLIWAEAKFELNNAITDAELNMSINLLRTRAGNATPPAVNAPMPPLTNAFVIANGLDMREEIRRERRVELAMEGFRYWDLNRWKTAEVELVKPIRGNFFFTEFGTQAAVKDADGYILLQAASFRSFNPARDYLFPIPTQEIAQNNKLVQNPGWF